MNLLMIGLAAAIVAGQAPAVENPLLDELLQKGVTMSDGTKIKLPPPALRPGMTAEAQRAAITPLARGKCTYEDLADRSLQAPFVLSDRLIPTTNEKAPARRIDLWFIAHGDWKKATSEEFLANLLKSVQPQTNDPLASKPVTLKEEDLARRNVRLQTQPGLEDRYGFGRAVLFEKVQLSSTRHGMVVRRADVVLMAEKIDPRFTNDPDYPNQWRSVTIGEDGKVALGTPQPYVEAGSYGLVTPLADPAGAIFFEFHMVYEEPHGWFGGTGLVSSKLSLAIQDNLRTFRRRLMAPAPRR